MSYRKCPFCTNIPEFTHRDGLSVCKCPDRACKGHERWLEPDDFYEQQPARNEEMKKTFNPIPGPQADFMADHLRGMGEKLETMTQGEINDFAAKTAAKVIATPSEKAGQARSKIPEQIAHLMTRIYADEISRREEAGRHMDEKLWRELHAFCHEHSTTLLPFDLLANIKTMGQHPQKTLDDAARSNLGHANLLESLSKAGPDVAGQILEHLAMQLFETQKILNLFGWTIDDLKWMARAKVDQIAKAKKTK